jgi:hypothetical protein
VIDIPIVEFEMPPIIPDFSFRESEIRYMAYSKWERAGRPPGDGVNFWLEAEKEWNGAHIIMITPFEIPETIKIECPEISEISIINLRL